MIIEKMVIQAQADQQEAKEELCRRFAALIKKYARRYGGNCPEDAMMEGYVALLEAIRDYEPQRGVAFAGFVKAKIKFSLWNQFKAKNRLRQRELPQPPELLPERAKGEDFAEQLYRKELLRLLGRLYRELSRRQQEVFRHLFIRDLSLSETAAQLAVRPQTVYATRRRIQKILTEGLSAAAREQ